MNRWLMVEPNFFSWKIYITLPKDYLESLLWILPVCFEFNNSSRQLLISHICEMMLKIDI